MANISRETLVTREHSVNPDCGSGRKVLTGPERGEYAVYYILGLLEILLALRFVLKLSGANPLNGFVNSVYAFSGVFTGPFETIFRIWYGPGAVTGSVFEPSTIVGMIVYAVIGWGIVKVVEIISGQPVE